MRALLTALSVLFFVAFGVVLTLFILDSQRLRGDAIGGHEEGGRFFVADHGRVAEVTEADWRWNRMLGWGMFCVMPLGMAAMGYLLFAQVFQRAIYRCGPDEVAAAERRIRATSPAAAETKCGGQLGWVGFGGPFLRVSVHAGGFVLKPLWMPAFGVGRGQVRAMRRKKVLAWEQLVVEHTSPCVKSPIVLDCTKDAGFTAALEALAPRHG